MIDALVAELLDKFPRSIPKVDYCHARGTIYLYTDKDHAIRFSSRLKSGCRHRDFNEQRVYVLFSFVWNGNFWVCQTGRKVKTVSREEVLEMCEKQIKAVSI